MSDEDGKKKPRIEIAPGAFDGIPEAERDEVLAQVLEMFADFDPEDPPGAPVIRIAPGTTTCPLCGGALGSEHVVPLPDGAIVTFWCEACVRSFGYPVQ